MIARGLRLTGLRREVLAALVPGRGEDADALRRRVAQGRGLAPESAGWPAFSTSFARALRLLERAGALEVRREDTLFGKACASWVALTELGARERERVLARSEGGLFAAAPETDWRPLLERASDAELRRLADLIAKEWARRT